MRFLFCAIFTLIATTGCQTFPNSSVSVITNPHADFGAVVQSVKRLKSTKEPAKFWAKIANDSRYNYNHRSLAAFQLIARYFRPGMELAELRRLLCEPTWITDDQIETVQMFAGYIPVEYHIGETVVVIKICPNPHMRSAPSIYLRLDGVRSRQDFIAFLRGHGDAMQTGKLKVLEVASLEYGVDGNLIRNAWGLNINAVRCD